MPTTCIWDDLSEASCLCHALTENKEYKPGRGWKFGCVHVKLHVCKMEMIRTSTPGD